MILEQFYVKYKLIIKLLVSLKKYLKYLQKYKPIHMVCMVFA